MQYVLSRIDNIGKFVFRNIDYTVKMVLMLYLSLRATALDKTQSFRQVFAVISSQVYFTGAQALFLITVIAMTTGSFLIIQAMSNLTLLGGMEIIGNFMVVMVVREVGPLLVALVVIARSGTAVASEIGTMKANKEIIALESMGVNPLSYIVFPRVVAGIISVICLAFYFDVAALLGGYMVTQFIHDMSFNFYLDSIMRSFAKEDLIMFILKTGFSGTIIFIVSSYQGLAVEKSPHEVPQVTTQAIMKSIVYVTFFNLAVTAIFYFNQLQQLGVI